MDWSYYRNCNVPHVADDGGNQVVTPNVPMKTGCTHNSRNFHPFLITWSPKLRNTDMGFSTYASQPDALILLPCTCVDHELLA